MFTYTPIPLLMWGRIFSYVIILLMILILDHFYIYYFWINFFLLFILYDSLFIADKLITT